MILSRLFCGVSAFFPAKFIRFSSNLATTGCIFVQVFIDRYPCIMTAITNDKF